MLSNIKNYSVAGLLLLGLSACGGGSSSGGESLAQEREASECISFSDGRIFNSCNFAVVARTFGGTSTPVTVPANASAVDPDSTVAGFFGACEAPFTPVETGNNEFECL